LNDESERKILNFVENVDDM